MNAKTKGLVATVTVGLLLSAGTGLSAENELPQLFVPDGQLLDHPIQISVSATNLTKGMHPGLRLVGFYPPQREEYANTNVWPAYFVAGDQSWTERVSGHMVSHKGTFLLFDLNDYPMAWYKSTSRVKPILTWNGMGKDDSGNPATVVGQPIYLGKRLMAAVWTCLAVGVLAVIIYWLCKIRAEEKPNLKGVLSLISGPDNYLSLWRTQLVAWTLAVGSMVFFFSVIQFQVPKIPCSLVALMGMSVATGSLSAMASRSQRKYQLETPETGAGLDEDHEPEFSDLVSSYNPDLKVAVLSVSKAQMLFWTGIILILFVTKSILTGELWDVPWEMVTLTGVSQAGYVSDKALHGKPVSQKAAAPKQPAGHK